MQPTAFLFRAGANAAIMCAIVMAFLYAGTAHAQTITQAAVVRATNDARSSEGASALSQDTTLTKIAEARLRDMFAGEYFDHKSPDGETAGTVAHDKGYEYTVIGENLAMGSYASPDELVGAWMESVGHRKNILQEKFTAIGVAVGSGMYDGEKTMMAVQVFARPLSVCAKPSSELKASIAASQDYIKNLSSTLNAYVRDSASVPGIRIAIRQASLLIVALSNKVNEQVERYNTQVIAYQKCARG